MQKHLLIIAALLLTSCGKDSTSPTAPHAADPCGTVTGISRTDMNGAPILPPDTDDWRWNDGWCPAVEALFAGRPAVTLNTTAPDSLLIACFPNPASNLFILGFYRDDSSYVDVRFVDAEFQLLASFDSLTSMARTYWTDPLGVTTPGIIRAYYRVVRPDGSAYRGHGDVQIEG